jgi:hypothetical protein
LEGGATAAEMAVWREALAEAKRRLPPAHSLHAKRVVAALAKRLYSQKLRAQGMHVPKYPRRPSPHAARPTRPHHHTSVPGDYDGPKHLELTLRRSQVPIVAALLERSLFRTFTRLSHAEIKHDRTEVDPFVGRLTYVVPSQREGRAFLAALEHATRHGH